MSDAVIMLGKLVEITDAEWRLLQELADEMKRSSFKGEKQWFLKYLTAHREAHTIISMIMKRSHASS